MGFSEIIKKDDSELLSRDWLAYFRKRLTPVESAVVSPLLYRSHLFHPISLENPALLLDMTFQRNNFSQRSVYATLYDSTLRCNFNTPWVARLKAVFDRLPLGGSENDIINFAHSDLSESDITRMFFTLADCNFDYASPETFRTSCRAIARLEDIRVSSNILRPKPATQAFSVALSDMSFYLCKSRVPYNFENSKLPRAERWLSKRDTLLLPLGRALVTPEGILRAMDYVNIISLDSLDSVVALAGGRSDTASPEIQISLTVGKFSLFACKDSLSRFVRMVSELSFEQTALDSCGLESLRAKAYNCLIEKDKESQADLANSHTKVLDDLKHRSALQPTTARRYNEGKDFLLDGYDWTTVDQTETSLFGILQGEEQAARWFGSSETDSKADDDVVFAPLFAKVDKSLINQRPQMISHHFAVQTAADPLEESDMGVRKFAGAKATIKVKSRLIVHDFALKLRFFDGYDWPDLLDERKRRLATKGAFIIDDLQVLIPQEEEEVVMGKRGRAVEIDKKKELIGNLLGVAAEPSDTFQRLPLPEEKGAQILQQDERRRLARRCAKYFQFSASGISLRLDTLDESDDHRLASCLSVKVNDFFLAETISGGRPVKMTGEWLSDNEHPRDTKQGLFTMKVSGGRHRGLA
jgi:hypothetical protein